jgi:hypothetical protein
MENVSGSQVVTSAEVSELPLPAEIQEALGELVGAARDGLLALSVGVGLRVVHELMEAEVTEIVAPKGKHDPDRSASRHGHEDGSMTLGGRRVPVSRPRARTLDGEELPVATYWPDAGASLREGMSETLTLMRLGITGRLAKSLSSTNPIESMIEIVRHTQRNVKRWQDGDMRKRWTAAGMLQAEQPFRRVVGYSDLPKLITAIEHRQITLESPNPTPHTEEVTATHDTAQLVTV